MLKKRNHSNVLITMVVWKRNFSSDIIKRAGDNVQYEASNHQSHAGSDWLFSYEINNKKFQWKNKHSRRRNVSPLQNEWTVCLSYLQERNDKDDNSDHPLLKN